MVPVSLRQNRRGLRRIIAPVLSLVIGVPAAALAVTPTELAELHRAGLGTDVLLALVETTGVQGVVDSAQALELRRAGVSDRVIAEAVRRSALDQADDQRVARATWAPAPNVAVIGGPVEPPPAGPDLAPALLVVPWVVTGRGFRHAARTDAPTLGGYRGFGRFINTDLRPLNDGFVEPRATRDAVGPAPPRR
jgi:hypothetical protein